MSLAFAVSLVRLLSVDVPEGADLSRHWVDATITLEVVSDPAAPDGLLEATRQAAAVWNEVGAGPVIEVVAAGELTADLLDADGVNRVGVLPGQWPYPPQAGAATVAWTSVATHEIREADVAINPAFQFGDATAGSFDLLSALTHELGHVLGLPDLLDREEATMHPAIPPGETNKRDLAIIDIDSLIATYAAVDLGEAVDDNASEVEAVVTATPVHASEQEMEASTGCSQAGWPTPALGLALLLAVPVKRLRLRHQVFSDGGGARRRARAAPAQQPSQRAARSC